VKKSAKGRKSLKEVRFEQID